MSAAEKEKVTPPDPSSPSSAADTAVEMSAAEEQKVTPPDPSSPSSAADTAVEDPQQGDDHGQTQVGEEKESGLIYDLPPSQESAFHMDQEVSVDQRVVQQLSEGFLQRFLPKLEKSKLSISEILNNQTVVIETLEQENAKFKDCAAHLDLTATMAKAKNYHNKLLTIKRDMTALHEKAAKLKRRALKLQQQKQKEELQRAHQEERELEKEQMLTAKVASPEI